VYSKTSGLGSIFFTVLKDKPLCLICNETVAVFKDFSLSRHFTSKHDNASYAAMTEAERKQKAEELRKNFQVCKI
jgi:hypothetical protein